MILLTGASGFIGSHLLSALIAKHGKNAVIAFTSKLIPDVNCILHNDYSFEENYFDEKALLSVDTIIHAGAFTPKSGTDANNINLSNSNIINTQKLLNLPFPGLKKIVFFSTLDVYKNTNDIISEVTPVQPQSLYGHAKLYCEAMIQAWCTKRQIEHVILRIGHVYGPGEQEYKKLIPEAMRALLKQDKIRIWGKGDDIRSFIYIDDVINAILASLKEMPIEGPVNIVSDASVSIREVVHTIIRISGKNAVPEHVPSDHIPRDLRFDNMKMKQLLHAPSTSFEEGIKAEWEAFQSYYAEHNF